MLYVPIEVSVPPRRPCLDTNISRKYFSIALFCHHHVTSRSFVPPLSSLPPQYALHVYNEVMSVGQKYGIRNAGYYALRSLRIEKFFAFWGQDLDSFTTPLECGREFRVKFDKVGQVAKPFECNRALLFLHTVLAPRCFIKFRWNETDVRQL